MEANPYKEIYELLRVCREASEAVQKQGDVLYKEIYIDKKYSDMKAKYTKMDVEFFELCTKRDMFYTLMSGLEAIVGNFPETAKVIYEP